MARASRHKAAKSRMHPSQRIELIKRRHRLLLQSQLSDAEEVRIEAIAAAIEDAIEHPDDPVVAGDDAQEAP